MTDKDETADRWGEHGQCTAAHHRREGERCQQSAVGEHGYCASHAPSKPEDTKHGRCTATSKSTRERCRKPAVGTHGKCRYHGGKTPTREDNPNIGAPTGNARNLRHGAYADPLNLYRHLEGAERQWIDNLVYGYADLLDIDPTESQIEIERILRASVHIYQSWAAEDQILEDGISEETVVGINSNGQPIITKQGHHLHQFAISRDRQAQKLLKDLGAFSDDKTGTADLGEMSSDSYTIHLPGSEGSEDSDSNDD